MAGSNADQSTDDSSPPTDVDPAAVRRRIRRSGEAIADRERDRALEKLAARGEVTSERRRVLDDLARGIVDGILTAPESAIETGLRTDREALETALDLFDPDR